MLPEQLKICPWPFPTSKALWEATANVTGALVLNVLNMRPLAQSHGSKQPGEQIKSKTNTLWIVGPFLDHRKPFIEAPVSDIRHAQLLEYVLRRHSSRKPVVVDEPKLLCEDRAPFLSKFHFGATVIPRRHWNGQKAAPS
jgi:hypothetical protein